MLNLHRRAKYLKSLPQSFVINPSFGIKLSLVEWWKNTELDDWRGLLELGDPGWVSDCKKKCLRNFKAGADRLDWDRIGTGFIWQKYWLPSLQGPARKVPQCANIEILVTLSLVRSIMYLKERKERSNWREGRRDIVKYVMRYVMICNVFCIMRSGGPVVNRIPIGYQCKQRTDCRAKHSSVHSVRERKFHQNISNICFC